MKDQTMDERLTTSAPHNRLLYAPDPFCPKTITASKKKKT